MDLVTPAFGLVFWTVLIFFILLILLRKFAWKPILGAVQQRNDSIEEALNSAVKAKEEMAQLKASNEEILKEAKGEREKIVKEARELKDAILAEAKTKASEEGDKIIAAAKSSIENEKRAAINEIKNQMASLSVGIAEKLIQKELSDKDSQKALINDLLDKTNIN